MSAATPHMTTTLRFGIAFAVAASASSYFPFVITPFIITLTGSREAGMATGVPIGIMVGWLAFPLIAWRPIRVTQLLNLPIVVLLTFVGFTILPDHWILDREADRNGLAGAILNVMLCALVAYGGLTWIRNRVMATGAGISRWI